MRMVLYTSPFIPAEWIAAHGFRPQRLLPRTIDGANWTGTHMGICPFAQAITSKAARSRDVAAVVMATTCDQMRRAFEIQCKNDGPPLFFMNVPATWQSVAARHLNLQELKRLGRFLEQRGGQRPSPAGLWRVMRQSNIHRWRQRPPSSSEKRIPVALIGGPLFTPTDDLFKLVRALGGWVAVDGTETGERTWPARFNARHARRNPLVELARAYFEHIPDGFRRPDIHLHRWLRRVVKERRVRGVIGIRHVWCDLWAAEMPRIRESVRVPFLDLDLDTDVRMNSGRNLARIQAFMETLQ